MLPSPMLRAVVALLLVYSPSLLAWNATGHRAITFLAYNYLTPKARVRVEAILKAHPDYRDMFSKGLALDSTDIARNAFTAASVWPDVIKGDARFADTSKTKSGPALPGFPDMLRHQNWHYINSPVPAEFRNEPIEPANALSEIRRLLKVLRKDGPVTPEEIYALPWLLHLISDVHQPLHTVSRFYRNAGGATEQDKGGNGCYLAEDRNLHSLWDNILGTNAEEGTVARLAASLQDHLAMPKKVDVKPENWIREGIDLSQNVVYSFQGNCRDREKPLRLPADYKAKARAAALQHGAMGAYRLAAILNEKFD
ncbi:MAG: S1/P1 nuclease [Bryobacteraceae bacterium]|nr:S1/P1 nuclease [Bryobacteraceae bacterium]